LFVLFCPSSRDPKEHYRFRKKKKTVCFSFSLDPCPPFLGGRVGCLVWNKITILVKTVCFLFVLLIVPLEGSRLSNPKQYYRFRKKTTVCFSLTMGLCLSSCMRYSSQVLIFLAGPIFCNARSVSVLFSPQKKPRNREIQQPQPLITTVWGTSSQVPTFLPGPFFAIREMLQFKEKSTN